jgi:hypothetical protein
MNVEEHKDGIAPEFRREFE